MMFGWVVTLGKRDKQIYFLKYNILFALQTIQ